MKRHIKGTHENFINPLQCVQCDEVFDSFKQLNKHRRAAHPKEKTVQCQVCQKMLSSKDSLKTHMLIHDDVRNYKCAFCSKSFRHSQALKKHEQLHKNLEKPNQCVICQVSLTKCLDYFYYCRLFFIVSAILYQFTSIF